MKVAGTFFASELAALALALSPVAAGCAAPGSVNWPDASPLTGEAFLAAPATGPSPGLEPPGRWWERFDDPVSDGLVELALVANLELGVASARVLAAAARAEAAFGVRLPALDLSAGAARSFVTVPSGRRSYANDYRMAGALSWQVDLFGRLRAAERARAAEWMASAADREALAHSLVASVLRARAGLAVAARRVVLARDVAASRRRTLEIVEQRYARGAASVSAVDVRLARENLAAAEARVPALRRELELQAHGLDELLGRKPGTALAEALPDRPLASELPEAPAPPLGVPAALLDRRPDLRAAAFRARAAEADVDVAVAALWPDLVLGLQGGFAADELGDLLSAESLFGSLLGDLALRLFAGGSLRAEVDAARAGWEVEAGTYLAAVLRAVREVEDALVAERRLREELERVRAQAREARSAEELARDRYARGLESLLTVLETERRRAAADDRLQVLVLAVWTARIDLHLGLGGGWGLGGDGSSGTDRGPGAADEVNPLEFENVSP